jgi:hypothetical protein
VLDQSIKRTVEADESCCIDVRILIRNLRSRQFRPFSGRPQRRLVLRRRTTVRWEATSNSLMHDGVLELIEAPHAEKADALRLLHRGSEVSDRDYADAVKSRVAPRLLDL